MADGECASCGNRGGRGKYRPVPLWLRIAAFPMIAIIFIVAEVLLIRFMK